MATILDDILPGEELVIERPDYSFVFTRRITCANGSSVRESLSISPETAATIHNGLVCEVSRDLGAKARRSIVDKPLIVAETE